MKRILLCDKDRTFISLLERQLSLSLSAGDIQIQSFDDCGKLVEAMGEEEVAAVILADGVATSFDMEAITRRTGNVLFLTQERSAEGIFKFRPVGELVRQIIAYLLEMGEILGDGPGVGGGGKKAQIIGVYSPVRPLLQSTLAITMGQLLGKEKKVLYMNFEPYSGMEYLMQRSFTYGLSDLLFYAKNRPKKLSWKVEALVDKVGELYFVPPVFSYPDLTETETTDFCSLITALASQTEYEVLILDLSDIRGVFSILQMCDAILCPYASDPLSQAKVDQYEKMLTFLEYRSIRDKLNMLKLPAFLQLPDHLGSMDKGQLADFIKKEVLPFGTAEGSLSL